MRRPAADSLCGRGECRNRSIDHVSPFDNDPAVEECVEPVKNLWSLLSWLDADCSEKIRLVTCSKHAMYMAILPASSKRGMSIVMHSGMQTISSYCLFDFPSHCCPRFVRCVHCGADGSLCTCGHLLSVVTLESHGSEIGGVWTGEFRSNNSPSGRPQWCGSFFKLKGAPPPELVVSGTGRLEPRDILNPESKYWDFGTSKMKMNCSNSKVWKWSLGSQEVHVRYIITSFCWFLLISFCRIGVCTIFVLVSFKRSCNCICILKAGERFLKLYGMQTGASAVSARSRRDLWISQYGTPARLWRSRCRG